MLKAKIKEEQEEAELSIHGGGSVKVPVFPVELPKKLAGVRLGVHESASPIKPPPGEEWKVSELVSGCVIGGGATKEEALASALDAIERTGVERFKRMAKDLAQDANPAPGSFTKEEREEFKRIFGVHLAQFVCQVGRKAFGKDSLDVVFFDRWLMEHHPYDESTTSCARQVRNIYGEEAEALIRRLITLDR